MAVASTRDIDDLAAAVLSAERTVVLAGQRLDLEGIRETDERRGEWSRRVDLDTLLTDPAGFWEFFFPLAQNAHARRPTAAHHALVRLQSAGAIDAIITQAADGLFARVGAHNVVEVYGSVLHSLCTRCGERYDLAHTAAAIETSPDRVPRCRTDGCAYPLRPAGTLWNEALPKEAILLTWQLVGECDLLLVVDSDLRTAPIALLPSVPLTRGARVIMIGAHPTRYDRYAHRVVRVPSASETLTALAERIAPSTR